MPEGTPIPAIDTGTIKLIQWSKVLGWVVVQTAADERGKIWYIGYCHLAKKPAYEVGHKVVGNDIIGQVGGGKKFPSGSASTGGHLHATASKTLKGVFGTTDQKVDLYKLIEENLNG
jgi:murein DD-endopeptidase MepM/ murein hydrolase activator NlpD